MPDRHNQRSNLVPTWRRGLLLVLAAVLVWGVVCGGCAPIEQSDCDQLLQDHQWQTVLDTCKDPYDRASAYLALGGFDLITLYNQIQTDGGSLTTLGIIQAFGLTTSNISTKRHYLELATQTVAQPEDSAEAFALLIASAMGMTVSSIELLDNGQGAGSTALDGTFSANELQAGLGFASGSVAVPPVAVEVDSGLPPNNLLSVVVGGTPYVLDCSADATVPYCDNSPPFTLYTDSNATYGSGAGFQGGVTSALTSVQAATQADYYIVQITDVGLGFTMNLAQLPVVDGFLGHGLSDQTYSIGLGAYLGYMNTAQQMLTQAGTSQGSTNTVSDALFSFAGQLDNGAACINSAVPGLSAVMNAYYPIYRAAIGTYAQPMPSGSISSNFFQSFNHVTNFDPTTLVIPPATQLTAYKSISNYTFGQPSGSVSQFGTRVLFPKILGLAAFTATQATPRVDETPTAFQSAFEALQMSPAISSSRDAFVSYAELLCIGAGPPPTGVTATASNGQVKLSWNAASGAVSYSVYRGTSSGVNQSAATKFTTTSTSYTDATVVHGTTYYYVVTSTNMTGGAAEEGGISREVSVTP